MGEYVKKKKDMKFQSQDALKAVQTVLDEAAQALNDKSRKISDSPIADALAGAVGVGLGAGIGFAGLYLGGSVVGLLESVLLLIYGTKSCAKRKKSFTKTLLPNSQPL